MLLFSPLRKEEASRDTIPPRPIRMSIRLALRADAGVTHIPQAKPSSTSTMGDFRSTKTCMIPGYAPVFRMRFFLLENWFICSCRILQLASSRPAPWVAWWRTKPRSLSKPELCVESLPLFVAELDAQMTFVSLCSRSLDGLFRQLC